MIRLKRSYSPPRDDMLGYTSAGPCHTAAQRRSSCIDKSPLAKTVQPPSVRLWGPPNKDHEILTRGLGGHEIYPGHLGPRACFVLVRPTCGTSGPKGSYFGLCPRNPQNPKRTATRTGSPSAPSWKNLEVGHCSCATAAQSSGI